MTTRRTAAAWFLLALLVACGESSVLSWRDLTLTLPEGWRAVEDRDTVLTITNGSVAPSPGVAGADDVLVQFQVVDGTNPPAWRNLVAAGGGTMEEDESVTLDGAVGTRLTWLWTTNGISTREMILIIPARSLEILFQPVALAGQTDAPEVFTAHRDEFEAIIASLSFGAPVE
ncbi:MAG: hypothetical protein R3249_06775 [Nitriliruptorales bacterium]|nr:hypothetical protein [Nitriliruptorales bacterium]